MHFRQLRSLSLVFVLVFFCTSAAPWGFFAHRKVNHLAIFALPEPLHSFMRQHIDFITEHSVDPDKRRHSVKSEAEKHYIDIDHYPLKDLETNFPRKWDDAVAMFTEDTLRKFGIAPWNAQLYYHRLVNAFQGDDTDKLLQTLADFGHYIGDIHVPLHTTENYNGQLTGQDGIHAFWESRLPELYFDDYDLFVEQAEYVPNSLNLIWQIIFESHQYMPVVLKQELELSKNFEGTKYTFEERGQTTVKTYSESFSKAYSESLNGMVENRLRDAVKNLSSLWFSAWVDAGQPDMSKFKN